MSKQKVTTTKSSFDVSALAASREGAAPSFAKAGITDPNRDDGSLELDTDYSVTITGASTAVHSKFGTPQLIVQLAVTGTDLTTSAGIDLPLEEGEGMVFGMSAEDEATYTTRAGERLLRLLKAIAPDQFNIYASIDKDGKEWTYYGFDGEVMGAATRISRADKINRAVMQVASLVRQGDVASLVGAECVLKRATNPKNAKYPYNNFYATSKGA